MAGKGIQFRLTMRDLAHAIAGSREALMAVADGHEPAIVAAGQFVRIAREMVAQPGTGRTYQYEWRTQREDPKYAFELSPGNVGEEWVREIPPHIASRPGAPPAAGPSGKGHIPGTLRGSIRYEVVEETEDTITIRVGAFAPYAQAMEYGSKHSGRQHTLPRPFMRPARQVARQAMTDAMIKLMRRRTKKILKQRGIGKKFGGL